MNKIYEQKRKEYLERIGLGNKTRVFIMNSKDEHIKNALLKRGWVELDDKLSTFFHLKWVYSDTSADYISLNSIKFIIFLLHR
jgi:hypothetical protein